jgi:hypothetical protein
MKMDIEGSEYPVLSTILVRAGRILCSSVKAITIEYHPDDAPFDFKNNTVHFHDFVKFMLRQSNPSCSTIVVEKDDESYQDDKFTLP